MKHFLLLFCIVFVMSCSSNPETHLEHINGYWEIEKVQLQNGTEKVYTFNETIDYIELNDSLKGFRKKLKPTFNNKYIASNDAENITAKIEDDSLHLYYKTPYSQWKETILLANETELKVTNANKDVYLYRRFKGLELDFE